MTSKKTQTFIPVCFALACIASGCNLGLQPLTVSVTSEMTQLTSQTPATNDPRVFDSISGTVNLRAGANETACFQIFVDAGSVDANGLAFTFSHLTSPDLQPIEAGAIHAFRMWPVRAELYPPWYFRLTEAAKGPAEIYDPLTPIEATGLGQPFDVDAGNRLAIWIDVEVPRNALPGTYDGQVRISSTNRQAWSARIKLRVYDFVLPNTHTLPAIGGFDYRTIFEAFVRVDGKSYVPRSLDRRYSPVRKGLTAIREMMQIAHDHRLDLFETSLRPLIARDSDGKLQLDWTDYDAIVMPYLTGSAFDDQIGCPAWPSPFSEDWPAPENYGGAEGDSYVGMAEEILKACREHLADNRQMAEKLFHWPSRRLPSEQAYAKYARIARIIRTADTETPILSELPPVSPPLAGWTIPSDFDDVTDINAAPAQWVDLDQAASSTTPQHPLVGMWLAPGQPPYFPPMGLLARPADVRVVPWLAMKYRCAGIFIPDVLCWSNDAGSCRPNLARLFYPGKMLGIDKPLPSVRLKYLRRGLQDACRLWILHQRSRLATAYALVNAMARYGGKAAAGDNYLDARLNGWVTSGEAWSLAHRLLTDEVTAAVHPAAETAADRVAGRLAWRRFDQNVHSLRVERVRVKLSPIEESQATLVDARISLELQNEYGRGLDVSAAIDKLPPDWRATNARYTLPLMPAGTTATTELRAKGPPRPSANGKTTIEISLASDTGRKQKVSANLPLIAPAKLAGVIVIDGKLDDWPMRAGNSAGAFKLTGRRGRSGDGLAKRQTWAFVLKDDANLYVAFRCEEPDLSELVALADNRIRYEQLATYGEDLVELLFDPGAKANSVSDLYHLVIKANGIAVAERGVGCTPPLGPVSPWPARAKVAVGKGKDIWTAEVAIPLSAFGSEAEESFWAVNFARFATQGSEASSWSGAARHFYDTRELGAMLMGNINTGLPESTEPDR